MGRVRRWIKGGLRRVSSVVARNELFERPGERPSTPSLPPRAAAGPGDEPDPPAVPAAPVAAPEPAKPPSAAAATPSPAPPARSSPSQQLDACEVVDLAGLQARLGAGRGLRVVNHWATWCIPCVEEFDVLKDLVARLPQNVVLEGISWDLFDPRGDEDDIAEHVVNFAKGHKLPWETVLIGESVQPADFFAAFSIENQTIPQTWVLDHTGAVLHRVDGALEASHVDQVLAVLVDVQAKEQTA
jgi:thiol-disulfide isomerase/thioredoxin